MKNYNFEFGICLKFRISNLEFPRAKREVGVPLDSVLQKAEQINDHRPDFSRDTEFGL